MDCTCHVPRKESSLTSGIVFSAGLKQEAPAPPVSWCVALLAGSAVCCDSQSWTNDRFQPAAGRNLRQSLALQKCLQHLRPTKDFVSIGINFG